MFSLLKSTALKMWKFSLNFNYVHYVWLTQCKNNLMTFIFLLLPSLCWSCQETFFSVFFKVFFFCSQFCLFSRIHHPWWRWLMICDFRAKFCNSIIHSVIVFSTQLGFYFSQQHDFTLIHYHFGPKLTLL
jgi:hypothetical protein